MNNLRMISYGLVVLALEKLGLYDISMEDKYIYAVSKDPDKQPSLLILVTPRKLSNKKMSESSVIRTEGPAVEALKAKAAQYPDGPVPCIAFVVYKYDLGDCEVCIAPVEEVIKQAKKGGTFNYIEGRCFYNYRALDENTVPPNVVQKCIFTGKVAENRLPF